MKRRDLLFAVLALLIIWQLAAWLVHRPILPSPIVVGQEFIAEIQDDLLEHFLASRCTSIPVNGGSHAACRERCAASQLAPNAN